MDDAGCRGDAEVMGLLQDNRDAGMGQVGSREAAMLASTLSAVAPVGARGAGR